MMCRCLGRSAVIKCLSSLWLFETFACVCVCVYVLLLLFVCVCVELLLGFEFFSVVDIICVCLSFFLFKQQGAFSCVCLRSLFLNHP